MSPFGRTQDPLHPFRGYELDGRVCSTDEAAAQMGTTDLVGRRPSAHLVSQVVREVVVVQPPVRTVRLRSVLDMRDPCVVVSTATTLHGPFSKMYSNTASMTPAYVPREVCGADLTAPRAGYPCGCDGPPERGPQESPDPRPELHPTLARRGDRCVRIQRPPQLGRERLELGRWDGRTVWPTGSYLP